MAVEAVLAGFPLGGVIISGRPEKPVGTFCIYGGPIFVHYGELEEKQNPPPGRSQKGVCVVDHSVVSGAAGPLCRSVPYFSMKAAASLEDTGVILSLAPSQDVYSAKKYRPSLST